MMKHTTVTVGNRGLTSPLAIARPAVLRPVQVNLGPASNEGSHALQKLNCQQPPHRPCAHPRPASVPPCPAPGCPYSGALLWPRGRPLTPLLPRSWTLLRREFSHEIHETPIVQHGCTDARPHALATPMVPNLLCVTAVRCPRWSVRSTRLRLSPWATSPCGEQPGLQLCQSSSLVRA